MNNYTPLVALQPALARGVAAGRERLGRKKATKGSAAMQLELIHNSANLENLSDESAGFAIY